MRVHRFGCCPQSAPRNASSMPLPTCLAVLGPNILDCMTSYVVLMRSSQFSLDLIQSKIAAPGRARRGHQEYIIVPV